jgi:hypothetical protein
VDAQPERAQLGDERRSSGESDCALTISDLAGDNDVARPEGGLDATRETGHDDRTGLQLAEARQPRADPSRAHATALEHRVGPEAGQRDLLGPQGSYNQKAHDLTPFGRAETT